MFLAIPSLAPKSDPLKPTPCAWNDGVGDYYAGPGEGVEGSLPEAYPQGQSLELALENAKLDVLERLMPFVVEVSRQQLLMGVRLPFRRKHDISKTNPKPSTLSHKP